MVLGDKEHHFSCHKGISIWFITFQYNFTNQFVKNKTYMNFTFTFTRIKKLFLDQRLQKDIIFLKNLILKDDKSKSTKL